MSRRTKTSGRCVGRPALIDREQLLDLAEKFFAERGFEGTSTRKLCEQAKCNPAMIAYYFKSKEGLYQSVIERYLKKFKENAKSDLASDRMPFKSSEEIAVFRILSALSLSACTNKTFHSIVIRELMTGSKRIVKVLLDSDGGAVGPLRRLLEKFKADGILKPDTDIRLATVTLIGPLVYSSISHVLIKNIYGFKEVDATYMENLAKYITDTFFRAWRMPKKAELELSTSKRLSQRDE